MKTILTFQIPPDYSYTKPSVDKTRLSQNMYVQKYIHIIDINANLTYFYPEGYTRWEGYTFKGCYSLKKILEKLPESFDQPYHIKFIH
jgi:hypothetical protein